MLAPGHEGQRRRPRSRRTPATCRGLRRSGAHAKEKRAPSPALALLPQAEVDVLDGEEYGVLELAGEERAEFVAQAASLVEPTDEWRSEGRGRPAQLYRYAPKKKRRSQRGVRFDLLQG